MIILQITAGVLLAPLTVLLLVLFYFYLMHWVYLLFILFFALMYSALCGFMFQAPLVATWTFVSLAVFYIIRMNYLTQKFHCTKKHENYPLIKGNIRIKKDKFRMVFLFPLPFLKLFKLLPKAVSRELMRKTRVGMEIPKLIDLILIHSLDTRIEVVSDEAVIYFEIQ